MKCRFNRFITQQGAKLVNVLIPGGGSAVNSAIAYSGTYAVGKAAILYYIEDKSKEEVQMEVRKIEELQNEDEQEKLEVKEEVMTLENQIEIDDDEAEKELINIEENENDKDKENKFKKFFSRLNFKKQKEEKINDIKNVVAYFGKSCFFTKSIL